MLKLLFKKVTKYFSLFALKDFINFLLGLLLLFLDIFFYLFCVLLTISLFDLLFFVFELFHFPCNRKKIQKDCSFASYWVLCFEKRKPWKRFMFDSYCFIPWTNENPITFVNLLFLYNNFLLQSTTIFALYYYWFPCYSNSASDEVIMTITWWSGCSRESLYDHVLLCLHGSFIVFYDSHVHN